MTDIELRWSGVPAKLQFRVQKRHRVTEGSYAIGSMRGYDELRWSEWKDVKRTGPRKGGA